MPLPQPTLPLDLTGHAPGNLLAGELHNTVEEGKTIALDYGAFFTESVFIKDVNTNVTLRPGNDYNLLHLFKAASVSSGKEVCSVIHFKDHISGNFAITYQAIGGEFSGNVQAIKDLIDAQNANLDAVLWGQILFLPEQFKPAAHLHHLGDLYGWEGILKMMDEIRNAILLGDTATHQAMYNYFDGKFALTQQQLDLLTQQVNNIPLATTDVAGLVRQVNPGTPVTNNNRFVTPEYMARNTNGHRRAAANLALPLDETNEFTVTQAEGYYQIMGDNSAAGENFFMRRVSIDANSKIPDLEIGHRFKITRTEGSGSTTITGQVVGNVLGTSWLIVKPFGNESTVEGAKYIPSDLKWSLENNYSVDRKAANFGIHSIFQHAAGIFIVNFVPGAFRPMGGTYGGSRTASMGACMLDPGAYEIILSIQTLYPAGAGASQAAIYQANFTNMSTTLRFTFNGGNSYIDPNFAVVQFWETIRDPYS